MKAMILAAGRGERLRPLTDHTPKPLLAVGGVPLIVWHIKRLAAAGVQDIMINHAWLGEQIPAYLGDGQVWGVRLSYSGEGATGLETAGGIRHALDFFADQPFLVVNGDVLCDIDFATILPQAERLKLALDAYLCLVPNPPHHPQGDFYCAGVGDDKVEDQPVLASTPRYTFSGIGLYHPRLFQALPDGEKAKLAPLLRSAMQARRVAGQIHQGLWLDVGTPERLAKADQIALQWSQTEKIA